MSRILVGLVLASTLLILVGAPAGGQQPGAKILIAFASYRERPKYPHIFFYEHDGVANGKIAGTVSTPRSTASADAHPTLSHDGRFCAYTYELENNTGRINFWDRKDQKLVELPMLNSSPNAQMGPSLSGDGKFLAFAAWNRPGATGQSWHVFLYDLAGKKMLELPSLNGQVSDERMPALSGNGRFLAFASNRRDGVGLTDVYLYDRAESKVIALPEMNSKSMDGEPTLNGDGRLIAFVSDRPGGQGGRDIYLFDRVDRKFLPLPGLNSLAHELTPSLTPDGRFIAFVSERLGGEGERDLYLYDRQTQKLLPTPGLNSKAEDFDPCIIMLKDE